MKKQKKNFFSGLSTITGVAIGLPIGMPIGLTLGIALNNMPLGVVLGFFAGLGFGLGIAGATKDDNYSNIPLEERVSRNIMISVWILAMLLYTAILFYNFKS